MQVLNAEQIAQVCHEANKAYSMALGDKSHAHWDEAPEWQRDSAIKGVQAVFNNPLITTKALHEAWLAEKRNAGWSYGPLKDEAKKEHPCCVPYDALPNRELIKDALFQAIVQVLRSLK